MPIHDWTRVLPFAFQDFRASWLCAISGRLNRGILPDDYYALLAPAALTVDEILTPAGSSAFREPWSELATDDEMEFYRCRKSHVVIYHVSHRPVAVVDVLSEIGRASCRERV